MSTLTKNILIAICICAIFVPLLLLTPAVAYAAWGEQTIGGFLAGIMIAIGGTVAYLGGVLLDFAVYHTVITFGVEFQGGVGVAVNKLWVVIRDLFNLLFIFTLIYIGLKTIIGDGGGAKKMLGGVIVAALLINFSLFITKVIVDFSNLAAYQVYEQLLANDAVGNDFIDIVFDPGDPQQGLADRQNASISGAFMNSMRLTTFADSATLDSNLAAFGTLAKIVTFGFIMMLFMIVAGFTFLAGAILLVTRFVVLVVLMVLSPAMFLVFFFPGLKSLGSKWWSMFLSNAFVAPAYLFMLLLSLITIQSLTYGSDSGFSQMIANPEGKLGGDFAGLLLYFVIAAGFLYGSTLVAKQMGAAGAGVAMKIVDTGRNSMQGYMYRKTGGNLADYGLNIMDSVSRATGGRLSSESWRRGVESARNYGAGGRGRGDVERDTQTEARRRGSQIAERGLGQAIRTGSSRNASDADRIRMEDAVTGATSTQLIEQLKELNPSSPEYQAIVKSMSANQYQKLMDAKPEDFDDSQKAKLKGVRKEAVETALTGGIDPATGRPRHNLKDKIRDASIDQLAALDLQFLQTNAGNLQASQLEKMENHDAFKGTRYRILKDAHVDALKLMSVNDLIDSRKNASDISMLPEDILDANGTTFTISDLVDKLDSSGKLTNSILTKIANRNDGNMDTIKQKLGQDIINRKFGGMQGTPGSTMSDSLDKFFSGGPGVQMR